MQTVQQKLFYGWIIIHNKADWTLREVLAQPPFWLIAVVNFCCCAAHSGPLFHTVSAAIDAGVGKLAAATVFAVSSLSSIPARLVTGWLADRYGTKTVLVPWLFLSVSTGCPRPQKEALRWRDGCMC